MRKTFLALVTSALALTAAVPAAQADPWRHRDRRQSGDVLLGGAVGLAAGALLGSALSQPQQPRYYEPAPRYYEPAARPVYVAPPSYRIRSPRRRATIRRRVRPATTTTIRHLHAPRSAEPCRALPRALPVL